MMKQWGARLLPHFFALAWAAGGWFFLWKQGGQAVDPLPLLEQGWPLPLAGLLTGYLSSLTLARLIRRFGLTALGGTLGYFLLLPPAFNLGLALAYFGQGMTQRGGQELLAPGAFVAVFPLTASLVLAVGVLLGILAERSLAVLWRLLPKGVMTLAPGAGLRLRIGLGLACVVALSAYGLRGHYEFPAILSAHASSAAAPAASRWVEREKELYRKMLAGGSHALLVVPMQARGRSVDRVSRSLMTRMLAAAAEQRLGKSMPDPTWVSRAFGSTMRSVSDDDIDGLARSMGAGQVLVSHVVLEEGRLAMRVTVELRELRSGSWQTVARKELEPQGFDDETPPAEVFRGTLEEIVSLLPAGGVETLPPPARKPVQPGLPGNPASLFASGPVSPLDAALRLQLVASLHLPESIEREHLFERSLMALAGAEAEDSLAKLLKARAYFHLHHRPYAVKLLAKGESPQTKAFDGILQGNLPLAEKSVEAIENQALKLIARLEAEDLRASYGKQEGFAKRRDSVLSAFPAYAPLLSLRLSGGDWFSGEATALVIGALMNEGVEMTLPKMLQAQAWAYLKTLYSFGGDDDGGAGLVSMVESFYPKSMLRLAAAPAPGASQLAPWDHFDLLFAINRDAYLKTVASTLFKQALPERALALAEKAKPLFEDHPGLAYLEAAALDKLADKAEGKPREQWLDRRSRLAQALYQWAGGETAQGIWLEWAAWPRAYEKYRDEPPRPYRIGHTPGPLNVHEPNLPKQELETRLAEAKRKLAYAQTQFELLEEAEKLLFRLGRQEDIPPLLAQAARRFVGDPGRSLYLNKRLEGGSRTERQVLLQRLIADEPDTWQHYFLLGKLYGEAGQYGEAQKTFLSYPLFDSEDTNPVQLSNEAGAAGRWLYARGEAELGRPLLELASGYQTGSSSEMTADELLAAMEKDWLQAAGHAYQNIQRYNDGDAVARFVSYLFLIGQRDQAWASFADLQPRIDDEVAWRAALTGLRMSASGGDAIKDWVLGWAAKDRHRDYLSKAQRERFAFMALTMDRRPGPEVLTLLQGITEANNNSFYYPTIAAGYFSLRQGNYLAAIGALEPIGNTLSDISAERGHTLNDMLPYLAYAYGKAGKSAAFKARLAQYAETVGRDFDYFLAQAVLEGLAGRHEKAMEMLDVAYGRFPPTRTRSFEPVYELLELTEWLLKESGHDGYRRRLVDWARRKQQEFPAAWAYSFEARHGDSREDRLRAIALAMYLDPLAERLAEVNDKDRAAAKTWFAANNPFLVKASRK